MQKCCFQIAHLNLEVNLEVKSDQHQVLLALLKTILKEIKVPCIPPIFHNNKYVTGVKENSEIFLFFLAN